jgi:hypothetical protein
MTTAMLGGMLLCGAWAAGQTPSDPPASPHVLQARAIEVQAEPGGGNFSSGGYAIEGQVAVPPGAAVQIPDGPPGGQKRVIIRRFGGAPDMPGAMPAPMGVPVTGPGGDNRVWIASATATLAGKAEKAPFLGVVTTRASATLRSQLKLKAGLVVDMVEPKSSAETAGLQVHDIIEKCDDQWLINPAQFIGLVRMYKPGETVVLTVLREGERKKIPAKLEEREAYALDEGQDYLYTRTGGFDPRNPLGPVPAFARPVEGFGGPVQQITAGALGGAPLVPGLVATFGDDKQQLLITIRDGHQFLNARDPSGKPIFDGPIDTPEQRKLVPAPVLKQLEEMEKIKVKIRTSDPARP